MRHRKLGVRTGGLLSTEPDLIRVRLDWRPRPVFVCAAPPSRSLVLSFSFSLSLSHSRSKTPVVTTATPILQEERRREEGRGGERKGGTGMGWEGRRGEDEIAKWGWRESKWISRSVEDRGIGEERRGL